ncbi:MAG TPA: SpoIIE family protein phosphatase [Candidatus Acidoferrales bacterium]|nr:SpoIIE family protein phosphatase [Candidatus Acidoferrales bacterium]
MSNDQVIELTSLIETAKILNSSLDYKFILNHIMLASMGKLVVSKSAAFVNLFSSTASDRNLLKLSKGIVLEKDILAKLLELGFEGSVGAAQEDGSRDPLDSSPSAHEDLRKMLAAAGVGRVFPIRSSHHLFGYLLIGKKLLGGEFTPAEVEFVSTLCNIATMAIDNARLFEESLAKQRLEEELNLARTIQEKLLPKEMPEFPGCTVSAFHVPTKQVGGDYFDVIRLSDRLLCVAIADVSGKGFPAALLMANLQSAFRALVTSGLQIAEVCEKLNQIVYGNTESDKFITFFAAIYDSKNRVLRYVNAGHNYPFVIKSDRKVNRLDKGGIMLGVMEDITYETGEEKVGSGDLVYLFTDGVCEAMNSREEQFTEEKLEEILVINSSSVPADILKVVRNKVASFVGDAPQSDDITQVCVKFL